MCSIPEAASLTGKVCDSPQVPVTSSRITIFSACSEVVHGKSSTAGLLGEGSAITLDAPQNPLRRGMLGKRSPGHRRMSCERPEQPSLEGDREGGGGGRGWDSGLTSVKSRLHSCGAATTGGGGPSPPLPPAAAGRESGGTSSHLQRSPVRLAVNSRSARTRVLPAGGSLMEADSLTTRPRVPVSFPEPWHHRPNAHESEQTSGDGGGQGGPARCSPWGRRVGHDRAPEQHSCRNAHQEKQGDPGSAGRGGLFQKPSVRPAPLANPWQTGENTCYVVSASTVKPCPQGAHSPGDTDP